jgi:hypothetical protein
MLVAPPPHVRNVTTWALQNVTHAVVGGGGNATNVTRVVNVTHSTLTSVPPGAADVYTPLLGLQGSTAAWQAALSGVGNGVGAANTQLAAVIQAASSVTVRARGRAGAWGAARVGTR